jgi:hypothetical protein
VDERWTLDDLEMMCREIRSAAWDLANWCNQRTEGGYVLGIHTDGLLVACHRPRPPDNALLAQFRRSGAHLASEATAFARRQLPPLGTEMWQHVASAGEEIVGLVDDDMAIVHDSTIRNPLVHVAWVRTGMSVPTSLAYGWLKLADDLKPNEALTRLLA